jgi:pimeloyl-ACP methyl ester carboxylesterase
VATYLAESAPTRHVQGAKAHYGYRELGAGNPGLPVVLLQRYRGTVDDWDPQLLEHLAEARRVIVFDNVGVGSSTGVAPATIEEMAEGVVDFLAALGVDRIDLIGWSMGGFVGQLVALEHPRLVHRLIVAGSGPGEPSLRPVEDPRSVAIRGKEDLSLADVLFLFFDDTDEGRSVGGEVLGRFFHHESGVVETVSKESYANQGTAINRWNCGEGSAWARLPQLSVPVLVANGTEDVMEPAIQSFEMVRRIPDAEAAFFSDAGHAFLFQRPARFAEIALGFFAK